MSSRWVGLIGFLVTLVLAVSVVLRGDRVVGLPGLLTGFGAFWSLLMAGQFGADGATDNFGVWPAVGIVPLVLGCALIVPIVARTIRSRPVAEGSSGRLGRPLDGAWFRDVTMEQ